MKHKLVYAMLLLALSATAQAEKVTCKAIGIMDGDTLKCLTSDHTQLKVRLSQIDAPEKAQSHGEKSKQSLSELVFGQPVVLDVQDTDRYGRLLATVYLNGRDINLEQVRRGYAWAYRRYVKDPAYIQVEREAKAQRRGLWQDPAPIEPEQWRRGS